MPRARRPAKRLVRGNRDRRYAYIGGERPGGKRDLPARPAKRRFVPRSDHAEGQPVRFESSGAVGPALGQRLTSGGPSAKQSLIPPPPSVSDGLGPAFAPLRALDATTQIGSETAIRDREPAKNPPPSNGYTALGNTSRHRRKPYRSRQAPSRAA